MAKKRKTAPKKPGGGNKKSKGKRGQSSSLPMIAVVMIAALVIGGGGGVLVWYLTSGTASGLELPDFAYDPTAPKRAPEAYQAALDIPDYLEQIPCYCGCGELDGHKNNLDCFIKSRQGDKVEWDDHAAG